MRPVRGALWLDVLPRRAIVPVAVGLPVLMVGAPLAFRVTGRPVWLIAASLTGVAVSVGCHLAFVRLHRSTAGASGDVNPRPHPVACLCPAGRRMRGGVRFGATQLGVPASVLSKHVGVLMDAGYVEQRKAVRDTRQRVWLRLTRQGEDAYHGHLAALRAIVGSPGAVL